MDSSGGLCSTEDALQAFLEHLVDPMLPAKSSFLRDTQSLVQQDSLAKQVHAVALLYNYYHRKQHPRLEFLGFKSFCKLAAILRPPLLLYMKLMQGPDDVDLDDLQKNITLTEKTIMDACDLCSALDASKDAPPDLDGWPVSKVSIFLVDSEEEYCLLQFSSATKGVWSLIEREIDNSENTVEATHIYRKKKITQNSLNASSFGEAELQQVAVSAVKDATGINQSDLLIMERHVVYSCSKENTSACFFVMKCNQVINEEDISQTPIQDVIDSLCGPLLKKESSSWTTTPVVEYFHLLPYAGIISQWVSRDKSKDEPQQLRAALANGNGNSSVMIKTPSDTHAMNECVITNGNLHATIETLNKTAKTNTSPKQNEHDGSYLSGLPKHSSLPQNTAFMVQVPNSVRHDTTEHEVEKISSNKACNLNYADQVGMFSNDDTNHRDSKQLHKPRALPPKKNTRPQTPVRVYLRKKDNPVPDPVRQTTSRHEVEQMSPDIACKQPYAHQDGMVSDGEPSTTYEHDFKQLKQLCTLASQENILSQTALKVLERKKNILALRQRHIEDEIAKCDKYIQTILLGGEDELEIELKTIVEACNDLYTSSEITQEFARPSQASPQNIKRRRLNEAVLSIENVSQELDTICQVNNWISPTYHLSLANGTFEANVTVKPDDFDLSVSGNRHSNPRGAKESAASEMLAKLRNLAGSAQ